MHAAAASWDIKYDLSDVQGGGGVVGQNEIIGGCGGGSMGGIIGAGGLLRNKSPLNSSIGSRISSLNNSHRYAVRMMGENVIVPYIAPLYASVCLCSNFCCFTQNEPS